MLFFLHRVLTILFHFMKEVVEDISSLNIFIVAGVDPVLVSYTGPGTWPTSPDIIIAPDILGVIFATTTTCSGPALISAGSELGGLLRCKGDSL